MAFTLRRAGLLLGAIAMVGLVSGCTRIRDHKGYVVDSTLIDTVMAGVDNRESVQKTLGRPSFAGQFDKGQSWYYVARDTKALAFSRPQAEKQIVLIVHFDARGNVSSVRRTGTEQIASIAPFGDRTPTLGRDRGFFSELFGNIGQVGAVGRSGGTADNPN